MSDISFLNLIRHVGLSSFGGVSQMRCRAESSTFHTNRLIHPYIVLCNTVVRSTHVGPLSNTGMRMTCCNTASQCRNGTGMTVLEGNHGRRGPLDAPERHQGSLSTVYKAKRASSVRSAFLWEAPGALAGWTGLPPGGDGMVSATFARSSRNLSNSERNKLISLKGLYSWRPVSVI